MGQANSTIGHNRHPKAVWMVIAFLAVVIIGLTYVKWWPYYHKALKAISEHTIGSSILTGAEGSAFSWSGMLEYAETYFLAVWKAALLGILIGSLVQVLLPADWLRRVLGKSNFRSTVVGGVASLPGMMCTCCAAPIAAGMRKRHVSVGAALAFWIGNPVLNPATLIFMTFVLSWEFTLIRVIFGVLLTFGISYLANRFSKDDTVPEESAPQAAEVQQENGPFLIRWMKSFGRMLMQVIPAYIITVLLLGAFQGFIFPTSIDSELLLILIFALAGTLFVIPTAAEIPIIQSFMALGVGTGPAAALLLTLPAVSLPSLLMLRKSFSSRVLLFVAISVFIIGLVSGLTGIILL